MLYAPTHIVSAFEFNKQTACAKMGSYSLEKIVM